MFKFVDGTRKRVKCLMSVLRSAETIGALHCGKSYLNENGWWLSQRMKQAVDAEQRPVPWYTYAAAAFLRDRLKPDFTVFEWGTGNSSLWYAKLCRKVISIEHNAEWCRKISKIAPDNVTVINRPECDSYIDEVLAHNVGSFDIIVIDGIERERCAKVASEAISDHGVIVFDDTDRKTEYATALSFLANAGFRQLDFHGMRPIAFHGTTTSIFYRSRNCLGI